MGGVHVIALYIGLFTILIEKKDEMQAIDIVIALYIGLFTTRFSSACSILSYILTHISFSVNIFLKKSVDLFFLKSRKAFI